MPTTHQEVESLKSIIDEFFIKHNVPEAEKKQLFIDLHEKVGSKSPNDSFRVSTERLRAIFEKPKKVQVYLKSAHIGVYVIAAIHGMFVIGTFAAFFTLPFVAPWYIWVPLCTLIVNLMGSPIPCPVTRCEDSLREVVGLSPTKYFLKYYFIDPARKLIKKFRPDKTT